LKSSGRSDEEALEEIVKKAVDWMGENG
jgi:hypothetical protein